MRNSTPLRRRVRLAGRILTGLLSLAVLAATATGWVQLRQLDRSTPTAAVIDDPPSPPSAEQNILLVGLDSRTDALGNPLPEPVLAALNAGGTSSGGDTTDTIIVVHVPAGGGRATAISVPRDAYVDLGSGLGTHKINSAYARGSAVATRQIVGGGGGETGAGRRLSSSAPGPSPSDPAVVREASAAGARATIGAVEQLTGLTISHYAAVNLAGFADMSAAVGGVPVCLRRPVDDAYSGLALPAGPQRVQGAQALAFVRQRHGLPNGDLDRIARQQVFLAGATEQLLSSDTLADPAALARLTGVASRAITLDEGWDLLAFAREMQGLSAGAVTFRTVPVGRLTMSTPDGSAVEVEPEQVRAFVADAVATDAAPAPTSVAPTATTPSPADRAVPDRPDVAVATAPAAGGVTAPAAAPAPTSTSTTPGTSSTTPGTTATSTTATPAPPPALTAAAPGCVN